MAQLLLYNLVTIPGLQGVDGVAMPQVMEPGVFQANGSDNLLKVIDDRAVLQVSPKFVCKNKVERVIPRGPRRKPPFHLLYPLGFQNPDDAGGNSHNALLPVFRFIEEDVSAITV